MSTATPLTPTDLSYFMLIADSDTPNGVTQYNGQIVGIPMANIPNLGSGPDNVGILLGIPGYPRANILPTTPPGVTEYLMTPALDNATRDFINTIPAPSIWKDTTQRAVYRQVARQLIRDKSVPAVDVRNYLQQLYTAAVANDHAAG